VDLNRESLLIVIIFFGHPKGWRKR
jgi:hypothetical protein